MDDEAPSTSAAGPRPPRPSARHFWLPWPGKGFRWVEVLNVRRRDRSGWNSELEMSARARTSARVRMVWPGEHRAELVDVELHAPQTEPWDSDAYRKDPPGRRLRDRLLRRSSCGRR